MLLLRCAGFNVLADAHLPKGDYSHVAPELLVPGARLEHTLRLIDWLQADVIGLQEVEPHLVAALEATKKWQLLWSPKACGEPDGCLLLVRPGITVGGFKNHYYSVGPHVAQLVEVGDIMVANTHIAWAPEDEPEHPGVYQTVELLRQLGKTRPVVLFADCNSRPGGRVRALIEEAGLVNLIQGPTALIDREEAAIDLLAVRGVTAEPIDLGLSTQDIPNVGCSSDHIPVAAIVGI